MRLSASISLDEAARSTRDAVVVGAGPAGSMAAIALARRGLNVLLVDRATFPRWKVCGCCLNGAALGALDAAGLNTLAANAGARPVTEMLLGARGRSAGLQLGRGVVLSREAFDSALIRAALAAGVAFLPGANASLGEASGGWRNVSLETPGLAVLTRAKVVIAADGLGGQLMARADAAASPAAAGARLGAGVVVDDAPVFYRDGTIFMACGAGGYVGLVRLEDGRLDVATALDATHIRAGHGPGFAVARLLSEVGWPVPSGLAHGTWKGTLPLTRHAERVATERVFAIGDAAGYVEPFTGEGISRALTAGLAVAPIVARAVRSWDNALMREWAGIYSRVVGRRQITCRTAAAVLRQPWLARLLIGILGRAPALARPVIRGLNTPVTFTPG
jgi:menaquinone-9 beta-reductase